ncbi:proliferation marker protein Ki-67 [Phyllostomus hastatus]|uniref:proliferation marker protein Ki-67 n=1 Tax=Phyllostomus hastatus TaxID=9423 RepID=UPI001E680A0F|nr:proliferation marker protein Ki-67 [Phyllostomus hastatus]
MGPAGRLVTIRRSGADGAHFPLSLSSCLFGRGVECDIRIQLPVVSRQHCKIEVGEQAVLFNLSSANPTQVNGAAIDGPVRLKHGDVITVIDRSFRYEDDRHQSGSASAEFPGQAAPRRVSRSGFSPDPDGEAGGRGAAGSQLTEDGASGEPSARTGVAGAARAVSRSSGGPAARSTPDGRRSEPLRDNRRHAAGPPAGGLGEGARGTLVSRNGGAEALPSPWGLEKGGEKESPFRKLYESMKEKLDVKSEKENVLQSHRKSGSRGHCAADSESAGGSWGETPRQGSPGCRRRSRRSSQTKAVPAPGQREEEGTGEGPGPTLEATTSPSVPPKETTGASTPVQCSRRNSSPKRQSGGRSGVRGSEPESPERGAAFTPKELFPGHGTPTAGEGADSFGNTPEKAFSRKRRSSLPPKVDVVAAEAEIPKPAALTPLLVRVERKGPGASLGPPQPRRATAGPPGLGSTGVGDWDESIHKVDGVPLKTRRVSFGGHLRPELFDENLPPNTPLKRGETPTKRRSLVTHAPAVLKKIIKGQPQESGKEDSSEIRLEVTAQNVPVSSPAGRPARSSSGANDGRRRSSKPPAWSGSQTPPQTEVPKRGGRRSGGTPAQRAAAERGQHGLLQMIQSRRRSGATEANLIVAKSWADIVKLSAKQTPVKAVKRGPPRQPSKRHRRVKTPKKPAGRVYSEFSTGHANSPCTIVIGKAHVEKVTVPARPYRMLNNLVFDRKIDFNEDLSGLTEMFKTPAKEKPKRMSLRPTTFSSSEGLFGQQVQVPESEEKPLLRAPAKSGESVSPNAQNVPEEPSDETPASPALRRQCMTVNKNMKTPPPETQPLKTASSANRPRRSAGRRSTPVPGTECEQEDPESDAAESISGRGLGKSPGQARLAEREMEESEGAFATWNGNFESRENSEKRIAVRRSRRSSELKGTPRADVIATKRPRETESTEDLVGTHHLLQTPGHAEAPVGVENGATGMCARFPKPEPVGTPAEGNGRVKTPSRSVSAEALSVLRKPAPTPGGTEHTHTEPVGGDERVKASQKFSEQQQDSADHVTGSRRRQRTPKRKPQPIEDLAGLKELFQTPKHTVETATDEKTMKIPSKSPKPEPVSTPTSTKRRLRTPLGTVDQGGELSALREPTPTPGKITWSPRGPVGDDEDIRALTGTPEQKLDSAEHVTGSRRRSRTPKRKAEPTEDLTGFKELFQTPYHAVQTVTEVKTMKIPSKSPKSEPVSTPTSAKRRLRTPLGTVDVEEELSALREPTPTPGEGTHSAGEPEGDAEDIGALMGTPEQKRDSAEYAARSRRRSRTPTRANQPTEDLAGLKELFQTPRHTDEPMTEDITTETPSKSPKPEPVSRPSSTKRRLRTPMGKVDTEEEFSALRKPTPTPGRIACAPRAPVGDDEDITALTGTPEQKRDSSEQVTGSRRRSRTPKRKAEPTEDLTGLKELFQTPNHVMETVTDDKPMKIPSKSPKPEQVSRPSSTKRRLRTPLGTIDTEEVFSGPRKPTPTPGKITRSPRVPVGDDEDIRALTGTPEQKLDSAEHATGSRRRSRTPKRKAEPTEDLTGLKELFQTPNHVETLTNNKATKIPSKSPKPEPVSTPTSTKRRLRTPLGKVDVEEELSALREPTPTPGEGRHSAGEPEGDAEDIGALKGTPEQKLDSSEHITGSRRRSRTPKRKVEPTEDLTGFKELFQTPNHVVEPVTEDMTMKIPSKSPKPEPVSTPAKGNGQIKTPSQSVSVEALSALRKSAPTPGGTEHTHTEPVGGDERVKASKKFSEQQQDSADHVTGSRRRSRTPKWKAEPTEDLAGLKELFQTPRHTDEPMTEDITSEIPSKSPKPEPVSTPARTKRRLRTPVGKVDTEEEFSALREPTPTPGKITWSPRAPVGDDEDIRALTGTLEQKRDSSEQVTGSRRRSRTPKRKAEPTEDLTGFKELFQTPYRAVETVTEVKTMKIPSKSPKPEPVSTPTSAKRRLRTPLGTVDVEEELSALREPTPTPGEGTHSAGEPEGDADHIGALKGTPEQKLDSAEHATGSRRRSRTPRRANQPIEDLAGLKELFQTPRHTVESTTEDKATDMPCKSAQAKPAVVPAGRTRRLRAPAGKAAVRDELSALRSPARASGRTARSHRELEGGDKDMKLFEEPPEQKLCPAENVPASKRKPRTCKEKAQIPADPASLKELSQTADHTEDPVAVADSTEMPSGSPRAEAVVMPARTRRQLRAPTGTVAVQEEPSALRRPTGTSGKTTRSTREREGADKDMKLCKESPEQKLDPAENVTVSKRKPRTRKEKAQFLEDLASLKELSQTPDHTEDPVAVADSTEMPSGSPRAEAVVMPARTRRQLRAPTGTVAVQEEPSALRRPTGTSGKTTRSHRKPVDGAEDTKVCQGPPRREPGPVGTAVGGGRQLRSRPGKAQPPHSPAGSRQLLQSPARDEELGTDTSGLTRTSTQTPDQSKPATTSRRARRARDEKPSQEPVDSRDPEKAPSESSVALSPKRKREDGSCAGPRRLRPRTRAQDPAEETPPPPRKRLRTAPREQCAPLEPSEPKRGRRVLREVIEPEDDLPSANGKTKNKGRKEDVASPDKGVSLRSGLRNKTRGAEQRPELLIAAEKGQRKRNEKKPAKSSHEVEIQNLEGGARSSAPGDQVHERGMSPRPGRRGAVPVPRGAEAKAQAGSVETLGATQEEKGGAPRPGVIRLRSRKVTVPPAGDALESQPKQRVTRSAKRPVEDANKENDAACAKKMRTRSRRGQ